MRNGKRNYEDMIYLTYSYHRDIFLKGGEFKPWVRNLFGEAVKFDGFSYGMSEPTIKVSLVNFEDKKAQIPTKNLLKINGYFSVLQRLAHGLTDFESGNYKY